MPQQWPADSKIDKRRFIYTNKLHCRICGANIPNLTKNDFSEFNFTEQSLLHINTDGGKFYSEFNYTEIF